MISNINNLCLPDYISMQDVHAKETPLPTKKYNKLCFIVHQKNLRK